MIYFIRNGDYIKIGRARNPEIRMAQLQTAHPARLELVAVMEGGPDVERALHKHFADRRGNGEWFQLTNQDVAAAVDEFRAMGAATIEEAMNRDNWLSILTFDAFRYAKAGGELAVEWTDAGLVLHLPGVQIDTEGLNSKFRRMVTDAPEPAPAEAAP